MLTGEGGDYKTARSLIAQTLALSKDDDDGGSENVAKKMNLRSFKLNRVDFDPLNICQMQATFPGVEFLSILFRPKKMKGNSSSYVHVLHKTSN